VFAPTGRITLLTKKLYTHFTFEPTLTRVHLKVTPNPVDKDLGTAEEKAVFRDDVSKALVKVFKWLTGTKGVKKILKLEVDDNDEFPCSEVTIRKCLEELDDVRYLNWKRPNISAQTLLKAPNVVELWLYSTGINAVLSSWADRGGLPMLKKVPSL
jgi:hypothetical protein